MFFFLLKSHLFISRNILFLCISLQIYLNIIEVASDLACFASIASFSVTDGVNSKEMNRFHFLLD